MSHKPLATGGRRGARQRLRYQRQASQSTQVTSKGSIATATWFSGMTLAVYLSDQLHTVVRRSVNHAHHAGTPSV